MSITEPETIHDTFKPLVYLNCFIGLGAFRQPNQSNTSYLIMKLYTVIITLFNWLTIYITLNSVSKVLNFDDNSPMAFGMRTAIVSANSCIAISASLLAWVQNKGLRDCVRQISILEDSLQAVLGVRDKYRKLYIRLISQIIATFLAIILVSICDMVVIISEVDLEMNMKSVLMLSSFAYALHQPILVMLILDVNFCSFSGYLTRRFQDLNDCLLELVDEPSHSCSGKTQFIISQKFIKTTCGNDVQSTKAESLMSDKHYLLREIRKAHWELCNLSQKINTVFGIQNLFSTAVSFAVITALSYTIYSAFSWKDLTNSKLSAAVVEIIWTAIYASKILIVNQSCWSAGNEAKRTGEVIYELLNSSGDEKLQDEIQDFGIEMLQNPVRFTACGLFTLDYTLVQDVIGSITTYLVILIQISNASTSSTFLTATTSNGTDIPANN